MSLDLLLLLIILFTILLNKFSVSTSNTTSRPCVICGKLTSLRCSRCHEAHFCSTEHMSAGWRNHRTVCRKQERPVLEALLFPADAASPVTVKIPYTTKVDTDRDFLRGLEMKHVSRLGSHGPVLDRALVVMYGSEFQLDSSPLNQCIAGLTGGRMSIPWAGNVLVLRQKGRLYSEMYESATMEDVDAMTRFFQEYKDFVPYAF
ncbi:hypothetical protein GGX14DRAFT_580338 [Mycena pura]|uniref:MYND-type domain-containing protein n=1 Tax=Mycena pura TaxID=153505 RepID=A0AAD6UKZ2_9AGAR|nr:hypothetical protein GGX14DRAFT_580338 [Mycena pura]